MTTSYYSATSNPGSLGRGSSAQIRAEFALIEAGFAKLPTAAAISAGYSNYVVDTGIANAYVVTPANLTTMADGVTLLVNFAHANTGASTITYQGVTGGGSLPLVRPDGTALSAGDIGAGQIIPCTYSAAMGKVQLAVSSAAAVAAAAASAASASSSASAAAASSSQAQTYAQGLNGSSSTSVAIGTGSQSFTASTGKQWVAGSYLNIASAANTANFMYGRVTSYNSGTGALVANVLQVGGSGTFADWVISLSVAQPSGATTSDIVNQTPVTFTTGGTSTAYTGTPTPSISGYVAGMIFQVTFNQASGDNPTLQISGVASPPNLVYQAPDGSFANIRANMITANHRTSVRLLSSTIALVERLPIQPAVGIYRVDQFAANFTVATSDAGSLKVHNSGSAHTITIPANATDPIPVGFTMSGEVPGAQGSVTIAINTDTLYRDGDGATGPRTISAYGGWTLTKVSATVWKISGSNMV